VRGVDVLPTEDLFVYVYVLVDDAISSRAVAIAARGTSTSSVRKISLGFTRLPDLTVCGARHS
jgi:hypothetical protein